MEKRVEAFKEKFSKDFPDYIKKSFVKIHNYEKNGKIENFALICNMQEKGLGAEKIEALKQKIALSQNVTASLCEFFKDNTEALNYLTTYYIDHSGDMSNIEEVVTFVGNGLKTNKVGLKKNNNISAYKINEDGSLEQEFAFKANFKIEKVNGAFRCWIDSAETRDDERGKGLYTTVLSDMLPKICLKQGIKSIALQADAFAINSDKTQKELESLYVNNGFTKVSKSEISDYVGVTGDDFEEGKPIFLKPLQLSFQQLRL